MTWTRRLQRYVRALITGKMPDNHNSMQYAASMGNVRSLHVLLQSGADINEGADDMSPLRLAVYSGKTDAVRLLLEHGADTKGAGISHALRWAELIGHTEIVHLLNQAGVDSSAQD